MASFCQRRGKGKSVHFLWMDSQVAIFSLGME